MVVKMYTRTHRHVSTLTASYQVRIAYLVYPQTLQDVLSERDKGVKISEPHHHVPTVQRCASAQCRERRPSAWVRQAEGRR